MCSLSEKTPTQLNAMTKAQLIAAALEGVTYTTVTLVKDAKGENVRADEITKNAYDAVLSKRTVGWTYYGTGEVDEITVTDKDPADKTLGGYIVKHYRGQRQPTLSAVKPQEKQF